MNYIPVGRTTSAKDMKPSVPQLPVVKDEPPMERNVTPANVKKYLNAEASLHLYGPVPQEVFEERKAQCIDPGFIDRIKATIAKWVLR